MYEDDTHCFGRCSNHTMVAAEVADIAVGFTQTGRRGNSKGEHGEPILSIPIEEGKGKEEVVEEDEALCKMGSCFDDEPDINTDLLHEMIKVADINHWNQLSSSNWDSDSTTAYGIPQVFNNEVQDFKDTPLVLPTIPFPHTPGLLNQSTPQVHPQSMPILFPSTGTLHDPMSDLNAWLGPRCSPPLALMKELFQSLPLSGSVLLGDGGEYGIDSEGRHGIAQIQDDGALEHMGKRNGTKQPPSTERERRTHMKEKFSDLRLMIPNSTKTDKASVVGDAVEYIKELKRTVDELKLLVEKKRCGRERRNSKRQKMEQDHGDVESCAGNKPPGESSTFYSAGLRSSMLRRKSQATEVDVRVIDDEVTVKLVQRRQINCLLYVSRVLDELQLDIQHVTGGQIGDHYSLLFNSKINEGSSALAGTIANKLMESMDGHFSVAPPDH